MNHLKARAARNGRSLQREIQIILRDTAENFEPLTDGEVADKIKDSLREQNQSGSFELLREDRKG